MKRPISTVSSSDARRALLRLGGLAGALALAGLAGCAAPVPGTVRRIEDGSGRDAAGAADAPLAGAADAQLPGTLSFEQAREVAFIALGLVDTPYRHGGNTPQGGFDCSGLIVYAFERGAGLRLPRTVAGLARAGLGVGPAALRSGDLVLFDTTGPFSHAGIYVGSGRFVHAPSSGGRVRLDGVFARYWQPRLSGARRV